MRQRALSMIGVSYPDGAKLARPTLTCANRGIKKETVPQASLPQSSLSQSSLRPRAGNSRPRLPQTLHAKTYSTVRWLTLTVCLALLSGCAQWKTEEETLPKATTPGLPEAKIPDSAAIVEVAFIPLPSDVALDDTLVPLPIRHRLQSNGIRAGRMMSWEPSQLELVPEQDDSTRLLRQANLVSDFESRRRRLSCRDSQPFSLVVRRPTGGEVAMLVNSEEGLQGRTLQNPQFTYTLRTRQMDDGRLLIRMTPEVQHGDLQQNFLASESMAFRVNHSRPTWILDELSVELPLSEGQAAVIMPTAATLGLGEQMFVGRRADQTEERIAVIVYLQRRPIAGSGK